VFQEELPIPGFTPVRIRRSRRRRRKTCTDCGATLSEANAYRRPNSAGFHSQCIPCFAKRRRSRHDAVEAQRRAGSKIDHCEICGASETVTRSGRVRRLTIDHNHETGEIRGILCSRCNTGLGMFRDSPDLLRAATAYLDTRGHAAGAEAIAGEPAELAATKPAAAT
jgi:hypothetical protein